MFQPFVCDTKLTLSFYTLLFLESNDATPAVLKNSKVTGSSLVQATSMAVGTFSYSTLISSDKEANAKRKRQNESKEESHPLLKKPAAAVPVAGLSNPHVDSMPRVLTHHGSFLQSRDINGGETRSESIFSNTKLN